LVKTVRQMFTTGRVVGAGVKAFDLRVSILEPEVADVDLVDDYPAFDVVDAHGRVLEHGAHFRSKELVRVRLWPSGWLVEHVADVKW
jgi:hypothetical protein